MPITPDAENRWAHESCSVVHHLTRQLAEKHRRIAEDFGSWEAEMAEVDE